MAELALAEKILRLHEALDSAAIPHAFGGALALAYYGEPRVTVDIDVNVFVAPDEYERVLTVLEPFGITRAPAAKTVDRDGQARVWWGRNPLDLFFAYDGVHDVMRERARTVSFGADQIPILAAEHLIVAKVAFNRTKDWIDLEQMLVATPSLDVAEINHWLEHLVGADDERFRAYRAARAAALIGGCARRRRRWRRLGTTGRAW